MNDTRRPYPGRGEERSGMVDYRTISYNDITVYYAPNMNGGGMHFGQDYIKTLKARYNRVFNYAYEFCCGPAYIGFSLLAQGLTQRLCLSDVYDKAIEAVAHTIKENGLADKVDYACQPGVKGLPFRGVDLIVSNPPHFDAECDWLGHIEPRIYRDFDWAVHREFYANVSPLLADDGIILFQENALGSSSGTFEKMIDDAGLQIVDSFPMEHCVGNDQIYYLEVRKRRG